MKTVCRKAAIHLFALPPLLLFAGQTLADSCDRLPPPSVTVKRLELPFVMNTQHSHLALAAMSSQARPGSRVLGLTLGRAIVQFEIKTSSYTDRTGRWECTSPQLTMTYGFNPMTLYVAKEFPAGTCAYNEVYQHELRHVTTYQQHLKNIEKDLADTLSRRFVTGGPWRGPAGQTEERLQKELDERWIPYVKREIGRVEIAQALIDTPAEYNRVAEACKGEVRRLIR